MPVKIEIPTPLREHTAGKSEVEVAGTIRLFVAGHTAHGGHMIDAVGGADRNGFDLYARESLAARFNDEIVGGGVAVGLGADESAAETFGDEENLYPFALKLGMGEGLHG